MAKMNSRWRLLSFGLGDARTPLGFIFLSACDETECVGPVSSPGANIPVAPVFLTFVGGRRPGKKKKTLLPSWRGQKQTAAHGLTRACACACVCACMHVCERERERERESLLVGQSDVVGREAGNVSFSNQN
jgi:hypothetical protein